MHILDLTPASARAQLTAWVAEQELPAYRAEQLLRRLWVAPVRSWAEATELPLAMRAALDEAFPLLRLDPVTVQRSQDGTIKYLWRLHDGEMIESVLNEATMIAKQLEQIRVLIQNTTNYPDGIQTGRRY